MKEKNLFAVELHLSRTSLNVASPLGIFQLIFALSLRAMFFFFFLVEIPSIAERSAERQTRDRHFAGTFQTTYSRQKSHRFVCVVL